MFMFLDVVTGSRNVGHILSGEFACTINASEVPKMNQERGRSVLETHSQNRVLNSSVWYSFLLAFTTTLMGCEKASIEDDVWPFDQDEPKLSAVVADSYSRLPNVVNASELPATEVWPHMEASLGTKRNYVYCITVKLLWEELERSNMGNVSRSPFLQPMARLQFEPDELPPGSFLTMVANRKQILESLHAKFGNVSSEIVDEIPENVLGFAYLRVIHPFREAFRRLDRPLEFKGTGVNAFGIEHFVESSYLQTRRRYQVRIVDFNNKRDFIIRLVTTSEDDLLVLAKLSPESTLEKTIRTVQQRVYRGYRSKDERSKLQEGESVIVPVISFGLRHFYAEILTTQVIVDLDQTAQLFKRAYHFISDAVARGGHVLFVGTKRQAAEVIFEEATRAGQFFVTGRWLGGTLTNFRTVKSSIDRLRDLERQEEDGSLDLLIKKEALSMRRERDKLEKYLGGIKLMNNLPSAMFVVDPNHEHIAVREARKLHIPLVALTDTNCDPDVVDFVIPGNDDAIRSIKLITSRIADACLEGGTRRRDFNQSGGYQAESGDGVQVEFSRGRRRGNRQPDSPASGS